MARIQVYFDGDCSVCSREMARCRALSGADVIDFVDINKDVTALESRGVTYAEALARLYVRDAAGNLHKGIAAYAVLFKELPRYRWLAWLLTLPGVQPILGVLYAAWANLRPRASGRHPTQH